MKNIFVHTKPLKFDTCYYNNIPVNLKYCQSISIEHTDIFFKGMDVSWVFETKEEAKKCYDKLIEIYSKEL